MERAFREYKRWKSQNLPEDLAAELLAMEGDEDKHLIASHTSYIPDNLHFVLEGQTVPGCEQTIDAQTFLK